MCIQVFCRVRKDILNLGQNRGGNGCTKPVFFPDDRLGIWKDSDLFSRLETGGFFVRCLVAV